LGDKIASEYIEIENLTKEEYLFLYLLKFDDQKEEYLVKDSITEQGIQNALKCTLGLISRILTRNEKDGYIYRKKAKIINKKNKQNVFFLTDVGLDVAIEIKSKIINSKSIENIMSEFF
jgi:DNA-binding PadR family transcriptional regulator